MSGGTVLIKGCDAVAPALGLEASKEAGSRTAVGSNRTGRSPEAGGGFALSKELKDGPCVQSHVSRM